MWRTALKSALAHRGRLFMTGLAVLLGVAFLSGALVFNDTLNRTFDDLFANVYEGTDVVVRAETAFDTQFGRERGMVDAEVVEDIRAVEGAASADGSVSGFALLIGADGEPIVGLQGAPALGVDWPDVAETNPLELVDGHAPESVGEVVIDRASADHGDLAVGDPVRLLVEEGTVEVTVVGIVTFGGADTAAGGSIIALVEEQAQELVGQPGRFSSVEVVADDEVTASELATRVAEALPDGFEVVTGAEAADQDQSDIAKGLGFFNTMLVAFAVVALFVGGFMIYNTFSITVAQRTREMALLRALGASRAQVLGAIVSEGLALAVVASALGVAAGAGVAIGLDALLGAVGLELPTTGLVFRTQTATTGLLVGIGITVVAAAGPAWRASRVPPIAAMRDVSAPAHGRHVARVAGGGLVTVIGIALLIQGAFGEGGLAAVAAGGAVLFFGLAALGPLFARPFTLILGWPIARFRGITGTLARQNALRNPVRTATTASALMIGVALVSFVTILAASASASTEAAIDRTFTGDFVVRASVSGVGFGGLSPTVAEDLRALPEVDAAAGERIGFAEIDGDTQLLRGIDPDQAHRIVDPDAVAGGLDALGPDGLAVVDDVADEHDWQLGDTVLLRFAETGTSEFTIEAVYEEAAQLGDYVTSHEAFEANFAQQFDAAVFVRTVSGVDQAVARQAIEGILAEFPNAELQDRAELEAASRAQVNQLLGLFYALLGLAVLIAVLGIANTLALSIFERTRELGLLRAVGMTRGQLRSLIRWEAMLIALFGGLGGLGVGVFFGWILAGALETEGLTELAIPAGQLAGIALVAVLAGVIASVRPGQRAARHDILDAITGE